MFNQVNIKSISLTSLIYLKEWRKDKIKSIYLIKIFIGYLFIKSFSFVIMILIDNWIILNWVTLFKRIVSHEIANLVTFNKRLSIYFIITLFLSILINFHSLIYFFSLIQVTNKIGGLIMLSRKSEIILIYWIFLWESDNK